MGIISTFTGLIKNPSIRDSLKLRILNIYASWISNPDLPNEIFEQLIASLCAIFEELQSNVEAKQKVLNMLTLLLNKPSISSENAHTVLNYFFAKTTSSSESEIKAISGLIYFVVSASISDEIMTTIITKLSETILTEGTSLELQKLCCDGLISFGAKDLSTTVFDVLTGELIKIAKPKQDLQSAIFDSFVTWLQRDNASGTMMKITRFFYETIEAVENPSEVKQLALDKVIAVAKTPKTPTNENIVNEVRNSAVLFLGRLSSESNTAVEIKQMIVFYLGSFSMSGETQEFINLLTDNLDLAIKNSPNAEVGKKAIECLSRDFFELESDKVAYCMDKIKELILNKNLPLEIKQHFFCKI